LREGIKELEGKCKEKGERLQGQQNL